MHTVFQGKLNLVSHLWSHVSVNSSIKYMALPWFSGENNGNTDIIQLEKALPSVVTAVVLTVDMKFSSRLLVSNLHMF